MSRWVVVAKKKDIQEGSTRAFSVEGRQVAITYVNGEFYAYLNACSHMDLPLEEGRLEGTILECPHHGATFDLRTGAALSMPAVTPLEMYEVKIEGDDIKIEFKD